LKEFEMEFMFSEGTEGKHYPEKDKDVEMVFDGK